MKCLSCGHEVHEFAEVLRRCGDGAKGTFPEWRDNGSNLSFFQSLLESHAGSADVFSNICFMVTGHDGSRNFLCRHFFAPGLTQPAALVLLGQYQMKLAGIRLGAVAHRRFN